MKRLGVWGGFWFRVWVFAGLRVLGFGVKGFWVLRFWVQGLGALGFLVFWVCMESSTSQERFLWCREGAGVLPSLSPHQSPR